MTPKEKAEELVIKMYQPLPSSKEAEKGKKHLYYNQYNAAKQCALIAVDEIKEVLNILLDSREHFRSESEKETVKYWQQVRKEIESL